MDIKSNPRKKDTPLSILNGIILLGKNPMNKAGIPNIGSRLSAPLPGIHPPIDNFRLPPISLLDLLKRGTRMQRTAKFMQVNLHLGAIEEEFLLLFGGY
jgi:hypothetical protein